MRSGFYATFVTTLGLVVASCSSTNQAPSTAPSTAPPPLVGRWEQTHHCDDLVQAFDDVGLEAIAPSCKGKHPQLHFHFFTASGQFGSLDKNEQQVDNGTYEIIDSHSFRIGDSTFRYSITGNDTLMLEPVITRAQRREALAASPSDFTTASWMANVAYEGTTWKRVPCDSWC